MTVEFLNESRLYVLKIKIKMIREFIAMHFIPGTFACAHVRARASDCMEIAIE
jgi:hypothetical protein